MGPHLLSTPFFLRQIRMQLQSITGCFPTSDAVQASRRWGASKSKCHEAYLEPWGEDKALTLLNHQSTPTSSSSFSGCIPGSWIHLEPRAAGEQWQRTANRSLRLSVGCLEKSPWPLLQRIMFLLQWILSIDSNAYSFVFQKGIGIILFICSYQSGRQRMDMVQGWNWEELSTGHQELRQNLLEARSWGRKMGRDLVICSNGQNQVCFIENHHKMLYRWGFFLCLQSWWQRSFFCFYNSFSCQPFKWDDTLFHHCVTNSDWVNNSLMRYLILHTEHSTLNSLYFEHAEESLPLFINIRWSTKGSILNHV